MSTQVGSMGLVLPKGITPAGSGKAGQSKEVVWRRARPFPTDHWNRRLRRRAETVIGLGAARRSNRPNEIDASCAV
jgi:hypothetical protein